MNENICRFHCAAYEDCRCCFECKCREYCPVACKSRPDLCGNVIEKNGFKPFDVADSAL